MAEKESSEPGGGVTRRCLRNSMKRRGCAFESDMVYPASGHLNEPGKTGQIISFIPPVADEEVRLDRASFEMTCPLC